MSGITFFTSTDLDTTREFYESEIGMDLWLDQGGCVLLKHGNLLLGFCEGDETNEGGVITFFYDTKEEVDRMYEKFEDEARNEPEVNEKYDIYNFFAEDIDGRTLEFQTFLHELEPYLDGLELLKSRRSVRDYKDKEVPEEILYDIFDNCRYAPTSMNSQGFYFVPIEKEKVLDFLAERRGGPSEPIAEGPMAVAVCCDPEKTSRPKQDGDIAAYHLMLAARMYGLGTCWIAAMDRDDVKEKLDIPREHYIATVTPLGYPKEMPSKPDRKGVEEFVREKDL